MARPPRQAVKTLIVCDDVRREANGKLILIGVYTGAIIPAPEAQIPFFMPLAFFVQFSNKSAGKSGKILIFQPNQKSPMIELSFDLPQLDHDPFAVLQFGNFVFPVEGVYHINIQLDGRFVYEADLVFQKRVAIAQNHHAA